STNGGATFPRSVRVNAAVAGRRFMPWVSAYGGMAVVSWYDRRFATMANNDLTRYYVGGATVRGPNLEALAETDLSGVNDQQCSLWPCATNAVTDSTSCSVQPQLGGICWTMPMMPPPPMPYTRCDFATTVCPGALTCTIGRGCPKYGDYNGNAVGAGRAYSAWASSTPPASVGGAGGALRVYASADRIPSDFYVRDWNDSPTQFDNGAQPSTHASFWSTSDVWNQSTNVAAAPGPGGYVVGDAPSRASSNYTFARVSRRIAAMPTAPAAPVTVHFYLGDYGLGAAFVDIGSEIATFATGTVMTAITPPHAWTAPVASSNHLCLAVQIVGPDGDTFALPSIVGTAPGPADPLILIDNNKAQRNLQDTIGTADGTELFATIRNAESKAREMRLRVKLPPGVKIKGTFHVIGGATFEIADGMRIDMGKLAPGEARWLRFHASSLVDVDKPVPIEVFEDTDPPANGFVILLHRDSIENVAKRNLIDLASVMSRLAKIEKNAAANALAVSALRAAKNAGRQSYLAYLQANRTGIGQILAAHFRTSKQKDAFDILAAANAMGQAVLKKDADLAATTHTALIERLDAHLTDIIRNKSALQ
ncbi:MAG: hypothetical protein HY255_00755, partial [Betaproteobacteria bacterium]|nr:hypothetical protein [Betaproteobacteria bacterium]